MGMFGRRDPGNPGAQQPPPQRGIPAPSNFWYNQLRRRAQEATRGTKFNIRPQNQADVGPEKRTFGGTISVNGDIQLGLGQTIHVDVRAPNAGDNGKYLTGSLWINTHAASSTGVLYYCGGDQNWNLLV